MTSEKVTVLCPTLMVVLARALIRVTADYAKIQDGIDCASPGNSAQVSPGTSTSQESLLINETLTLVEKTSTTSL
ncbi:MAG: hypothetical protein ABR962_00490 [Candidatus Bathyarchaeia archaeon]|jgi:hypothetical protein